MQRTRLRRNGALVVSAALLASLTLVALAATTNAAPPECGGKTATIVGTNRGETLVGTAKADVIVALGGNERCAASVAPTASVASDGTDKLVGGAGNDRLDGGSGRDTCSQGRGWGVMRRCELPVPTTS